MPPMKSSYFSHRYFVRNIVSLALLCCCFFISPHFATAGVWQVSPIRLDFDSKARSGVITVRNDGEDKLFVTIDAKEWTQAEEGNDVYLPTSDLLFFPKQLTILPKEERIIRVGTKTAAVTKEKTFRLFIKEEPEKRSAEGAVVNIAMQFAVPVFIKPPRGIVKGMIRDAHLEKGEAQITVANEGNGHFRINTVRFTGKNVAGETIFSQEVNGWYLLSGVARRYSTPVPEDKCKNLHMIDVRIESQDRTELNGKIDVGNNACRPQQ